MWNRQCLEGSKGVFVEVAINKHKISQIEKDNRELAARLIYSENKLAWAEQQLHVQQQRIIDTELHTIKNLVFLQRP